MRLHRNLTYAVIDSLRDVFNEGEYAGKAVEKALKRDKRWGSRDRKFVAETIYEIVRWKRLYAEIANVNEPFDRPNLWRLFTVWCVLKGIALPDWNQIEETPTRRIKGKFDELSKIRKYRESIPNWMDELCVSELGEELWTKEMATLNTQADVVLRVNTLNISRENLQKELEQ
ncbi:MAG: RNA methyltransferase, partial [Polaribacter sp.]|nr:RNA methyltransferase [Polaribacter sp.]